MYIQEVPLALTDYLRAEIPELKNVLTEWPEPNEDLDYPSLSVRTHGTPKIMIQNKTFVKKVGELNTEDNTQDILYSIGMVEVPIRIDIWAGFNDERADIYQKINEAFQKSLIENEGHRGLRLQLERYFDAYAEYLISGYTILDDAFESQTASKRAVMNVECIVPDLILVKGQHIVETAEIETEISEEVIIK